jgi:hypothetical protein
MHLEPTSELLGFSSEWLEPLIRLGGENASDYPSKYPLRDLPTKMTGTSIQLYASRPPLYPSLNVAYNCIDKTLCGGIYK